MTEGRHRFHSICPYFAMFPETFAETWIENLTKPGHVVLDPFCGRGTVPFQALLMGRGAIAVDTNEVAYCVTRAKTNAPALSAVRRRITHLENCFDPDDWEGRRRSLPEFFRYAFSARTLRQLLFLRSELHWRDSDVDAMIAALALGSLHGESEKSPSYLSNQMPRTISTKPDYSVRFWKKKEFVAPRRDAFELLRSKAAFRYESVPARRRATVFNGDMRTLPSLLGDSRRRIRCVVTSPPYFDVTHFREDQWLRIWLLGGPPHPSASRQRNDDRHGYAPRYWKLIADMWRILGVVLAEKSDVVLRIGAVRIDPKTLVSSLVASTKFSKRKIQLVSSEASEIRRRQTDAFRPGTTGCTVEVDCHFAVA